MISQGHGWPRTILIVVAYLLPISLIVHAITFWGHGIIDSEAMEFVLNYLLKRPFFAQIFDPQINDWGPFQARELSHVFDLIDARFFAWLLDRHLLVFVPLSGALGLIALSAIYFWGARKVLGLSSVSACMLLSLFLSCIVVQASTPILYRSSKIILSVVLVAFLFYLWRLFKTDKRNVPVWKSAALFLLGFLMSICDPQGFYYLISSTLVVALLWLIAKARKQSVERAHLRIMAANGAALAAAIFYNRSFAPWLIHRLNGYWPDFSLQNLPISDLLDPNLLRRAFQIFCHQISFFFGNIPFFLVVLIVVATLIAFFWKRGTASSIDNWTIVAMSLAAIVSIFSLLAIMIARHPPVYTVRDHEFWYYTLSIHVVILFGITAWLSFVSPEHRARLNPLIYATIATLIVLNIRAYNTQRNTMIHSTGWFDSQYVHSQALLAQFHTDPPRREKLQLHSSDLFLDDQAHFLENVELSYLHLIGVVQTEPVRKP
jgi:hypothetical protein